jgi:hypothetical protein
MPIIEQVPLIINPEELAKQRFEAVSTILETRFRENEVELFELILTLIQTFDVIELERLDEATKNMNLDEAKNYINGLKISPSRLKDKIKKEEAPVEPVANSNDTNDSPPEAGADP